MIRNDKAGGVQVMSISTQQPIDIPKGMEAFDNNQEFYLSMLESFFVTALKDIMPKLKKHYENKDYNNFHLMAHSLKGSSGYVGAGRLHYQCSFIQDAYLKDDFETMISLYPALIESVIEFKFFATDYILKHNGKSAKAETELPEHPDDFEL